MKKQYKILFILFFLWNLAHPQSVFYNYLKTSLVKTAGVKQISSIDSLNSIQTVKYFDGLGRHIQTVQARITPNGYDMVQPVCYDSIGRQAKTYLPYVSNRTDAYIDESWLTNQADYYDNVDPAPNIAISDYPFAEVEFDNSPLNRVMKQGAPGAAWQLDQHPVEFAYQTNNYNDSIIIWEYNSSTAHASKNGYYATGTLYIVETTDENGNVTKEYKDLQGRVVLKTSELASDIYYTYYVYDDFGNLGTVIPPKAYALMEDESWSLTDSVSNLVYTYKYDQRQRMVEKQIPGAEAVYMVYDKLDRLVLTQDGNMRDSSLWMFTKYDAFSRPVSTGTYAHGSNIDQAAMQAIVNGDQSFPTTSLDTLTLTYYDNYSFDPGLSYTNVYEISSNANVKGLQTGSKVKVLGTSIWLLSKIYYDDKNRLIQTRRQLYDGLNGGIETVSMDLSFTGQVEKQKQSQTFNGNTTSVEVINNYDHAQRLTKLRQVIGSDTVTIADLEYNELGQLTEKTLAGLEEINYGYNIRGWLNQINDPDNVGSDLFTMKLLYEDDSDITNLASADQFNGNISGMVWNEKESDGNYVKKGYGYLYDEINRLTAADYGEGSSFNDAGSVDKYNEYDITYDENGNIQTLKRNSGSIIDNLSYVYENSGNSNRLATVGDASGIATGFSDVAGTDYAYDANGNLIQDNNKSITNIEYNLLNLPKLITKDASNTVTYIYSATGEKLCKETKLNDTVTKRYYCDGFEYDNAKYLALIHHAEGVVDVTNNGTTFSYEYFLKDHLGNTRIAFRKDGGNKVLTQREVYYPFGLTAEKYSANSNQYKYNGKELQEDLGLNWYDYGARMYDAQIGRFHNIDPMGEFTRGLTPYHYVCNNPIALIDPTGMYTIYDCRGNPHEISSSCGITIYEASNDDDDDDEPTEDDIAIAEAKYWFGVETDDQTVANIKREQVYLEAWAPELAAFYEWAMQQDDLSAKDIALLAAERSSQVKGLIMMKVFSPETVGMILFMATDVGVSSRVRKSVFKYLARHGSNLSGQGFKSFNAFKKIMGKAGKDKHWHHIVEQTKNNIARFGNESVHNTRNLVRVNATNHYKISAHYSSKLPGMNQTVRKWLSTKSYEFQYNYGINILKIYSK